MTDEIRKQIEELRALPALHAKDYANTMEKLLAVYEALQACGRVRCDDLGALQHLGEALEALQ